jgi:hypothetical protein
MFRFLSLFSFFNTNKKSSVNKYVVHYSIDDSFMNNSNEDILMDDLINAFIDYKIQYIHALNSDDKKKLKKIETVNPTIYSVEEIVDCEYCGECIEMIDNYF